MEKKYHNTSFPTPLSIRIGKIFLFLSALGALIGVVATMFLYTLPFSRAFSVIFYGSSFLMSVISFWGLHKRTAWGIKFSLLTFTVSAFYSAYRVFVVAQYSSWENFWHRGLPSFVLIIFNVLFGVLFFLQIAKKDKEPARVKVHPFQGGKD